MAAVSADRDTPYRAVASYRERLRLPWWLWACALGLAALLAAEVWMGTSGVRAWLPFSVLLPVTAVGLWWLGRIPVRVTTDEFQVDDARLPLRHVADVVALDADGRRELLGVGADPLAFVIQRPWVSGAVQIVLDDPADPTPYWVVSSREPVRLAAEILAARDRAPGTSAATADTVGPTG
ncbi:MULTISPECIES: DUF3093 domain-containing protein [unclassified Solwaraspora]|uniref:DUF3093 domain-containing protein n=1 Tax=unclassified Solwaraspora TaxID=2627926 RepID=UPI00259B9571|nr:DUF3093 domain-containing protein [Solwaraspora sp. WMMA2056]WJK39810.1 DUF3093 domain-containing protein [Solwaraspora sp. WMMA2056]